MTWSEWCAWLALFNNTASLVYAIKHPEVWQNQNRFLEVMEKKISKVGQLKSIHCCQAIKSVGEAGVEDMRD